MDSTYLQHQWVNVSLFTQSITKSHIPSQQAPVEAKFLKNQQQPVSKH